MAEQNRSHRKTQLQEQFCRGPVLGQELYEPTPRHFDGLVCPPDDKTVLPKFLDDVGGLT